MLNSPRMYDFVLPPFQYNIAEEASYPTPYVSTHLLPLILLSMMTQKHTPVTTNIIKESYDYVIGSKDTRRAIGVISELVSPADILT
ncbi:hypothetical protein TNCV_2763461 [Trichonephila clavipes]|nr:hypothetical protein TNCV_2763461 [Trichonephila clavipes]